MTNAKQEARSRGGHAMNLGTPTSTQAMRHREQLDSANGKRRAAAANWKAFMPAESPEPVATVREAVEAYLEHLVMTESRSLPYMKSQAENWILPALGEVDPRGLTVHMLGAWIQAMRGADLADQTIRQRAAVLRAALGHACKVGRLEMNPAARLPPGVLPPKETRPGFDAGAEIISAEEAQILIGSKAIPLHRRVFYGLLAFTGARTGEVDALVFGDLDLKKRPLGRLTIERSWSRQRQSVSGTKTGRVRKIPIHPFLREMVGEWRAVGWRDQFRRHPTDDDLIVPRHDPKTREPTYGDDKRNLIWFHRDLKRLGLERRRLHAWRHSFVSALLDAGVEFRVYSEFTHPGAREGGPVIHHYAHPSWKLLCEAILRLPFAGTTADALSGRRCDQHSAIGGAPK